MAKAREKRKHSPFVDPATVGVGDSRPPAGAVAGVVVRAYGKFFAVALVSDHRTLLCTMTGLLKRVRRRTDIVAVGDRVWASDVGEGEGVIEAVEPRTRVLARLARHTDDIEQVILANPDQALFLLAAREPTPHPRMLDRFLVLAESQGLPALIGVNKIDLVPENNDRDGVRELFRVYETVYPVCYLSVRRGDGIDELAGRLAGKITAVAGPSGVGKSSLLNRLDPDRPRAVGVVSLATGKGRHTTTATELYQIGPDTFVADTPGIRALALHGVPPETLDRHFPEFRPYLDACFYADCSHLHEPGCAVREAVDGGEIARVRYASFAALRGGDADE